VRTDNVPFAGPLGELLVPTGRVYSPPRMDEFGSQIANMAEIFTNTELNGQNRNFFPCDDWTSATSPNSPEAGNTIFTTEGWTDAGGSATCSARARLFCLQLSPGPNLPPFAVPGKIAFVTSQTGRGDLGSWPYAAAAGATGITAGDATCRESARLAGLANYGSFKAWLSGGTVDARDRITTNGPWVRLDGIVVAGTKGELIGGANLSSSLHVTEYGAYVTGNVWTGTRPDGTRAGSSCNAWVTSASGVNGGSGVAIASQQYWTEYPFVTSNCSNTFRIYCLED